MVSGREWELGLWNKWRNDSYDLVFLLARFESPVVRLESQILPWGFWWPLSFQHAIWKVTVLVYYFTGFPWAFGDKRHMKTPLELSFSMLYEWISSLGNKYRKWLGNTLLEVFAIHSGGNKAHRQAHLYKLSSEEVILLLGQIKVNKGLLIQLLLLDIICLIWIKCQLLNPAHLVPNPSWKTLRWSPDLLFKRWLDIKSRNKLGM